MKHKLLISAAALCLAWPAASWADQQQPGDQQVLGEKRSPRTTPPATGPVQAQPTPSAPPAPTYRGPGVQTHQGPPPGGPGVQAPQRPRPSGPTVRRLPPTGPGIQPPVQPGPTHRPGPTTRRLPPGTPGVHVQRGQRPPPNLPRLGGWNRDAHGPDRDRAGQQWRQEHRGWDSRAPWRRDSEWWRHNNAFRLFFGPRLGYFFIPEYGYIAVPPQYERHYWIQGDYLPNWFWRYTVNDYWNYGLPQPPDGCVWVWVDNDVALIDASDGYILDIVHNAW